MMLRSKLICTFADTISCGNDIISPKCSLCPKAHNAALDGWCGGHCEVDKTTGDCKEGLVFLICFPSDVDQKY